MSKTENAKKNKTCGKSVNPHCCIKYQKKIPKTTKVLIKNKSHNRYPNNNSSGEFKSIIKQIYADIDPISNQISKDNIESINNLSPRKYIVYNTNPKNDRIELKTINQNLRDNFNFEKAKERLRKKRIKIYQSKINANTNPNYNNINTNFILKDKDNEEIFAPLDDRFTQISIIKPRNDIFSEQSSEKDNNEEYIYFYEPKKELKYELCNSSKREIKCLFDGIFMENKLKIKDEIDFMINGIGNEEKSKYELKIKELAEKEEKYDKLISSYNSLLKELNDIKNKNTINSELTRSDEKIVEHLEDIAIIKDYITIQDDTDIPEKEKAEKINRKEVNSVTPTIRNTSSSVENKTRDTSKKDDLHKNKNKKCIPNIMSISKENEFNLTASPKPKPIALENNSNKKHNKKIKKTKKRNSNWNALNEVVENTCFNYLSIEPITKNENTVDIENKNNENIENNNKNKGTKKKILKRKVKKIENEGEKSKPTLSPLSTENKKKVKRINLPIINIKNETRSYNIQKNYIRFSKETKSVDFKINKDSTANNLRKFNKDLTRCLSESISFNKKAKPKNNNNDVIVKKINLKIINNKTIPHNKIRKEQIQKDLEEEEKEEKQNINTINTNTINNDENEEKPIIINKQKVCLLKRKKKKLSIMPINDFSNKITKIIRKIILRNFFTQWKKIYKATQDTSIINHSENRDISLLSCAEIKDHSKCYSEDEKHLIREEKEETDENKVIDKDENKEIKKEEKNNNGYKFRIKIVKYGNKKNKSNKYFSVLFQELVNKLLIKRVFKKWLKLSKIQKDNL